MPLRSLILAASLAVTALPHPTPDIARTMPATVDPRSDSASGSLLPGREDDARVARIAFRLATAGHARCPVSQPATGLVLQHLLQFQPADRPGMVTALALDRGPAVIAVVPGSPAARAGIRAGDVLLRIGDTPLPREEGLDLPFDAGRAHARIDAIDDLLARAGTRPLALLRTGAVVTLPLDPVPACPTHVNLARSTQRNAYADGRHVFLTTGLVAQARSDDELAFIVAHEMAHNILGHAAIMRSGAVAHGIGRTLGRSGETIRTVERAADALGGNLMLDAGYDPVAGAALLRRMGGGDLGIELFATHDSAAKRIAAMQALVAARGAR